MHRIIDVFTEVQLQELKNEQAHYNQEVRSANFKRHEELTLAMLESFITKATGEPLSEAAADEALANGAAGSAS
jgi:hypothetical protein